MLVSRGDTEQVIDQYRALLSETTAKQKNQRDLDQSPKLLDDHGRPMDVQYMRDVNDSVVNIKLRDKVGLFIFSAKTTLEKTPHRERRAGERVIVDFTFQVPLKHGRYSVAVAVSHLERKGMQRFVPGPDRCSGGF